jgi:hypothetical protein
MKKILPIIAAAVLMASCGSQKSDSKIIATFYDAVLGNTEMTDGLLKSTLSEEILESLWEQEYIDYYSFWLFRTGFQDGPSDLSQVDSIEPLGDGWYQVTYTDMGITGVTCVKMEDGKITEYKPYRPAYTLAKNYFKRNDDVNDVLPVKITSEEELLEYFGYATVMGRDGEPTKIDFDKSFVIPIILPDTDRETEIKVKGLYHLNPQELTVAFSAIRGEEPMSYTISPFLLLVVDGTYRDCQIMFDTTEKPYASD